MIGYKNTKYDEDCVHCKKIIFDFHEQHLFFDFDFLLFWHGLWPTWTPSFSLSNIAKNLHKIIYFQLKWPDVYVLLISLDVLIVYANATF